ncbi:flagellar basal-body rod modification protein FlgD [Sphingomonas sp. PP-F2F-G114-C0414]|uniref:flagellar hook assembly protein FlgD n=1 Tax=Sphingomonas sp. PP-F2F-G114-C0414 TaxID=2135662 RepID=UPI000EF8E4E1|nr:flagellar hook capping FlgD N-terminal domain-containing protein [Sphingomonas sp. PP-F2F-G114-C0414]RMB34610.1 flagellar basal-body rod modification protein FlgD [Sphingomonas sp. PP-F2F-G114-C0414]
MATSFDSTLNSLGIARTSTAAAKTATPSGSSNLGQSDFLKLMTAQMQNQDPFNPVDNTQMVAQMAQISTTSGISEMNSTMKAIADKLGVTSTSEAMGYVGKTVLTAGTTAYGRTGGGIAGSVELAAAASGVNVTISDASGAALKTMALGPQAKGTIGYDWDGKNAAGVDAGNGPFTISVAAQSGGAAVGATNLVWAPVQSVSTTTGSAVLTLPGIGEVPASAIRQIG